jgi:hypothetical protein
LKARGASLSRAGTGLGVSMDFGLQSVRWALTILSNLVDTKGMTIWNDAHFICKYFLIRGRFYCLVAPPPTEAFSRRLSWLCFEVFTASTTSSLSTCVHHFRSYRIIFEQTLRQPDGGSVGEVTHTDCHVWDQGSGFWQWATAHKSPAANVSMAS